MGSQAQYQISGLGLKSIFQNFGINYFGCFWECDSKYFLGLWGIRFKFWDWDWILKIFGIGTWIGTFFLNVGSGLGLLCRPLATNSNSQAVGVRYCRGCRNGLVSPMSANESIRTAWELRNIRRITGTLGCLQNSLNFSQYRRSLETCPQAKTSKSGREYFLLFFSDASERQVWLSAESKKLASTFERFRLYPLTYFVNMH